jgi:hypothetical protein
MALLAKDTDLIFYHQVHICNSQIIVFPIT